MAESVDALDLKSNQVNSLVPVQVWLGAFLKTYESMSFLLPAFHFQFTLASSGYKFTSLTSYRLFIL